jgi:hypothetical protein
MEPSRSRPNPFTAELAAPLRRRSDRRRRERLDLRPAFAERPFFDGAQGYPLPIILFILHSRPKAEEGKIVQEQPVRSTLYPSSVAFHRLRITALRVELRRARLESPGAVAEILVALDQELEALVQAKIATQDALHPGPRPKSS